MTRALDHVRAFGVTPDDITKRVDEFGMQKIAPIVDRLENTFNENKGLMRELTNS